MVFSTVLFLFRFLPITLALYYLAPARLKNTVLFLCSLVFYSWGEVLVWFLERAGSVTLVFPSAYSPASRMQDLTCAEATGD